MLKYFSERVSPGVHDGAAKKEGFGEWKEQFLHDRFAKQEDLRRQDHELELAARARKQEEEAIERKLHGKTRSASMLKYFSERVSPGVHDGAAKKEGFGEWKEQFMHESFEEREKQSRATREEDIRRHKDEHAKERKVHVKTRSTMMIKYFSEKINPKMHDVAAEKMVLSAWGEAFLHR